MTNFRIEFQYPWLLLLLVAAVIFTLLPYFRIKKRYRNTRNRIISMILHMLVSILAVTILAGMEFKYNLPNYENEIIILVDMSDSEESSAETRDLFVQDVISDSEFDGYNVGVVTFGFDQVYAAPLTTEIDTVYANYTAAEKPDCSATNIAGALRYTASLFNHPKTAKIVLVTDGKETDEDAVSAMQDVITRGIRLDTAYVASRYEGDDVQITSLTMPDHYVQRGLECELTATVFCTAPFNATLKLTDNGTLGEHGLKEVNLVAGFQNVTFKHVFEDEGVHELCVTTEVYDGVAQNNQFTTYHYLEVFDKVLVIESANQSEPLKNMLTENAGDYEVTVMNVGDEKFPKTVDELRAYHQIILNNVANADLPDGFDLIMQEYVSVYGGGMLTLGGNDDEGKSHAYNRTDMYGSVYQEMLPVEVATYTPPIGVMLIIDSSGSMLTTNDYGTTYFESAKAGALACLDVLYDRDYVGIMTLATHHANILELTERSKETVIKEALANLEPDNGNTVFGGAIENAGVALRALKNVAKRHMIVITDGMTEEPETYLPKIREFYEKDGITFSVIGVNMVEESRTAMKNAVAVGHGRVHEARNTKELIESVRNDLLVPKIEDVNAKAFKPIVNNPTSPIVQGLERGVDTESNRLNVELGGFYGSKIKKDADLILIGDYDVPIYAQWRYGAGMVGSFMCDLQASEWSRPFMENETGKAFVKNAINNLMPVKSLEPHEINVKLSEDNYTNELSVFANLEKGETVRGEIVKLGDASVPKVSMNAVTNLSENQNATVYVRSALGADNQFSRCSFVIKDAGVYEITLTKCDENGNAVGNALTVRKSFAYSEEYDQTTVVTDEVLQGKLIELATTGEGSLIVDLEDTSAVFNGFTPFVEKVFDPRWLFMILAIALFLLDVAVCKFKFKWIHEIVRDYKRKKNM